MSVKKIVNGDLARGSSFLRVSGAEEIAQGVDARLQKLAGEDPYNLDDGTKYLDLILRKGTPEALILGELERRILSQPGMVSVEELDIELVSDRVARVVWSGQASVDTLNTLLRIAGKTEINA